LNPDEKDNLIEKSKLPTEESRLPAEESKLPAEKK